MKLQEVFAYNLKSQHILNEGWDTLNESQRLYLGKAERELWPLMEQLCKVFEAELTADQIQSIFKGAETHAMDTGTNKTALGKAGDAAGAAAKLPIKLMKTVNDKINELGKAAQKTGPVQHIDKKFEDLKKQIGSSDGKIVQGVKFISDWAKENPGKASLAVAILTAAAAFATGPGGGAAVGFLLKGTKGLLKGDKLSSATGQAAKMAAVGAGIGALGDQISELLPGEISNTFINDASGEIDVTQLSAMDATSLADIDADAANELIQTQGAMQELMRSSDLDAEAKEILQGQWDQVNAKIVELNGGGNVTDGIDNMQAEFDIEGTGADIEQTTSGTELDGSEIDTTEVTAELSASELNDLGINSADFPDNEWLTQNTQKFLDAGMTQEQIDALQDVQGFERALANKEFMGMNISSDMESAISTDNIKVDGIPDDISVGETFKSSTSLTLDDGTVYSGSVTTEISGVDANGNAVYKLVDVQTMTNPMSDELSKALEALPEEMQDELFDKVMDTGVASGSMETAIDNTTANIVKAAAAVGIGAGLAKADLKPQAAKSGDQTEFDFSKNQQEAYKRDLHRMLAEVDPSRLDLEDPKYQQDPKSGTQTDMFKDAGLEDPNTMGAKAKRGLGAAGKWAKDKVAGGVAGVKQGMKDAGNKVTANKLNKAWKKAGSPMDTGAVVNILADAGLSNDDITSIGTSTKVDLPQPTSAEPEADAGAETGTEKDPEGVKPNQGTDNKIENGTTAEYDGKEYTQQGGEWLDPNNKKAPPEIEKELDAQVATPKDEETVPSDGGTAGEDEAGAEYKPKKDDIVSWIDPTSKKERIATVVEPVAPADSNMSIVQIDGQNGTVAITTSKLQSAEDSTAPDKPAGAEADPTKAGAEPTAERNPKIKVAAGAGQMAKGNDGEDYVWAGGQWINNTSAKVAKKEVAAELGTPGAEPKAGTDPKTDTGAGAGAEADPTKAGAEADPTKAGAEADPTKAGAEAEPEAGTDAGATPTAGTDAGATPTAGTDKAVNDLANEITKAGAGEEVKAQLQSNGAGGGAAEGGEVDLPQLASDLADAGVQEIARNQLLQK